MSGRPSSFDRPTGKVELSKRVHLDACSGVIANRKGRWVRFRRKMSPLLAALPKCATASPRPPTVRGRRDR